MPIAYISHDECLLHDMGPHPECPARLNAINDRMLAGGLDMVLQRFDAPQAELDLLRQVHDPDLVDQLLRRTPQEGLVWLDDDTALGPHTVAAARRSAGAMELAVELVLTGQLPKAFCAVRPPGHHATRTRAMGFCFFNNVVIGAHLAQERYGLERVAIVDFDVHHGNGTEDLVADRAGVLFCSTFQYPLYPNTGVGETAHNVVNVPLPGGSGGAEFRTAVEQHWLPRLAAFQPELILVSAGFDGHQADDMAGLNLVDADYAWVTHRICEQADASADGRVISTLEGGYALRALALSVETHLKALLGE